ncbi:MAG: DUF349 domain-containing protein [Cytophagales bacterium]
MLEEVQTTLENEIVDEITVDNQLVEEIDFTTFSKLELQKYFEKYTKEGDIGEQFNALKKVKPFVEEIHENEKTTALEIFVTSGGSADDFEYKGDGFFEKFESAFAKIKANFVQQHKDAQLKKDNNLKSKNDILAQMKALIDSGSAGKATFEKFKVLQSDWKNAGQVPFDKMQDMWSNYQAVVNRFYDQRSIAFELLDLDRKKNLQAKTILIEKVEKLGLEVNIQKALKELDVLQEEFKHIGPTPKEVQDETWAKFREASNKIYERKKEFLDEIKIKFEANLVAKQEILARLEVLTNFTSEKPDEWANQTKLIDAVQEEWKKAGLVEKEKAKEVNRQFWDTLKKFFNAKRAFFKELEKFKNDNLKLKTELCEKAELLASSYDSGKTAQEIIELQKEWKTIGHVPLKVKDKIYERFKKACDEYFNAKRSIQKEEQNATKARLQERYDFVESFEKAEATTYTSIAEINSIIHDFSKLPSVTGNADEAKLYNRFIEAIKVKLKTITDIDAVEKDNLISKLLYKALKTTPDGEKELFNKEKKLRKDLRDIEENIAQLKNNIEFFAKAKNAEAIRKDFNEKIEVEEQKLKIAKARLSVLLGV